MKLTNNKSRGLRDRLFSLSTTGTCLIWIVDLPMDRNKCLQHVLSTLLSSCRQKKVVFQRWIILYILSTEISRQ